MKKLHKKRSDLAVQIQQEVLNDCGYTIARALLVKPKPKLLICDEATSALDVSIQGQIINLLSELKKKTNISILFISHDLALVQNFCDKIYVMREGEIVEKGSRNKIINCPEHPYTKLLLSSNFSIFAE